ncbi:MAG: DUF5675 family protein [Bacteroidales bacterium]|jgi:hypothetical protein|nr:DUF5675 family protein [Bacteroidales bacterium]
MNLTVIRKYPSTDCVIGELFIDGVFECYTLEDVERPVKIAGVTAIPRGHYELVITFSARFQKLLPLLLNVPNFDGVRIHTGNTAAHTEGCILVGKSRTENQVLQSKDAFAALFPKLQAAAEKEKIILEVKGV